ncbi:MAG: hypothetical protein HPY85_07640 [Anaerolineae bacterium]|jgi:hypothetical protein|nr:hypothetical protein [Anaerolineae bacterium]
MADEVYMDIPQVERMAKSFDTFGDTLEMVSKVLQGISITLKVSAFLTLGGSAAAAAMIDRIQPRLKKLGEKMVELSGDITSAVKAYRDGDLSGSRRFV